MQGIKQSVASWLAPRVQSIEGRPPQFDVLSAAWKDVVARYNDKSLTDYGDRLPALSGIAKRAKAAFQSEYLAGLWSRRLESQLCWSISTGGVMGDTEGRWLSSYRAPSWWWASVEGPIQWNEVDGQTGDFRVLEARCFTSDLDPTGRVRHGYLAVEGAVIECIFARPQAQSQYLYRAKTAEQSLIFDPDVPFLKRPYSEDMPLGTPLFCIAIGVVNDRAQFSSGSYESPPRNFLVLKRTQSDPRVFQRIGWASTIPFRQSWVAAFERARKREMLIV
jgi:hypothetical protein